VAEVIDIWCEDCGAQFRNHCRCPDTLALPLPEASDVWVGADGHRYVGDRSRPSSAFHADDCPCSTTPDW